jgi:hypothetical protein
MKALTWIKSRASAATWLDLFGLFLVVVVTMMVVNPSLVFSTTTITGGDTGSHLAISWYLHSSGHPFSLTPWYPGWFAGMPAYTYYFVLPDALAAWASYVINFAIAFKLATLLGSVTLPFAAYIMGRCWKVPRPIALSMGMFTLPFLFDASFTIVGGNLFSTMAGEYAFSLSLSAALVAIGLFSRGMRTGKGYWWAAIALSVTLAAHILPWFFAIACIALIAIGSSWDRRKTEAAVVRIWKFCAIAGALSLGLSAWWLWPFGSTQGLTNPMGYTNDDTGSLHVVASTLGWFNSSGGKGGDQWIIIMALVALVVALVVRSKVGMLLSLITVGSFAAYLIDPQSAIWNERLVPFFFLGIYLLGGWLVGYVVWRVIERSSKGAVEKKDRVEKVVHFGPLYIRVEPKERVERVMHFGPVHIHIKPKGVRDQEAAALAVEAGAVDEPTEAVVTEGSEDSDVSPRAGAARRVFWATLVVIVLGLATTVPGQVSWLASALGINTGGNQVSSWAAWNYAGYQKTASWPEYHNLMETMSRMGKDYGCGRAMWEYNSNQNRFGTPEALMLLPYWTNNCIGSMEGLLFESSATTPYHFLDQAELSDGPSDPMVGLDYGNVNVKLGVRHLQMLGVRYYMAFSPDIIAQAKADPALTQIAVTKDWPSPGVQWHIYLIKNSALVTGLNVLPNVVANTTSRAGWLAASQAWWLNGSDLGTPLASSGPASWPRVASGPKAVTDRITPAVVSDVRNLPEKVSFSVNTVGKPVLVKISYYPDWHATGALGPYRVSPNLMVVIPTSKHVSLTYSPTGSDQAANLVSQGLILVGIGVGVAAIVRRRRRRENAPS